MTFTTTSGNKVHIHTTNKEEAKRLFKELFPNLKLKEDENNVYRKI